MSTILRLLVNEAVVSSPSESKGSHLEKSRVLGSDSYYVDEPKVVAKVALKSPRGRPIQIAHRLCDGGLRVMVQSVNEIFDKVGTNDVAIYSVCGPTRSGKSFLLTRFSEYLSAAKKSDSGKRRIEEENVSNPFTWDNRSERLTTGIWMWSEPLKLILPNGKMVCILLVDCQGCFDEKTSLNEDANIFALSTLISSVQVFNVKNQIDESVLQFLELFTGVAISIRLTCSSQNVDSKFQKLIVLVRDFQLKGYDYGYHSNSGMSSLEQNYKINKLDPSSNQPISHQQERTNIVKSYEDCGVFLLPHPGKKFTAADDVTYLDEDYLEFEEKLVRLLCDPSNIVVKTIDGVKQNGQTLKTHVQNWAAQFENSNIPILPRTSESVSQLQLLHIIKGAEKKYRSIMDTNLRESKYRIERERLAEMHELAVAECLSTFSVHNLLFGRNSDSGKFKAELEKSTHHFFDNFQDKNLLKTEYHWYYWPFDHPEAVLAISIFGYIGKKIFDRLL